MENKFDNEPMIRKLVRFASALKECNSKLKAEYENVVQNVGLRMCHEHFGRIQPLLTSLLSRRPPRYLIPHLPQSLSELVPIPPHSPRLPKLEYKTRLNHMNNLFNMPNE